MPVVGAAGGGGFGNRQSPIHNLVISSFIIGTFAGYIVSLVLKSISNDKTTTTTTPKDDDDYDDDTPSQQIASCDNTDINVNVIDDNNVDVKENVGGIDQSNSRYDDEENFDHDENNDPHYSPGMIILEGVEDNNNNKTNNSTTTIPSTTPPQTVNKKSIRMVVQRCRTAKLEIDAETIVTIGNDDDDKKNDPSSSSIGGLLVYISFAKGTTEQTVNDAAKTLLQLPLLTHGKWGDGSKTHNVLDIADSSSVVGGGGITIMIVPQANLTSSVKRYGKSIQYHDHVDKSSGLRYYETFLSRLEILALDRQCRSRGMTVPPSLKKAVIDGDGAAAAAAKKSKQQQQQQQWDASIAPEMMFHDESLYASWDDVGFPLTDIEGKPTTKSARKKMKKMYETQKRRHESFLSKGVATNETAVTTVTTMTTPADDDDDDEMVGGGGERRRRRPSDWPLLDENFLRIVGGTFGNRQGLEFKSDMGPFCHVIDL